MKYSKIHIFIFITIHFFSFLPFSAFSLKNKKDKEILLQTFSIKDAGIELLLQENWFPQNAIKSRKNLWTFVSLKGLAMIKITDIPFQINIDEKNMEENARKFTNSIRIENPEFEMTECKLTRDTPRRLHIEGQWIEEGVPVRTIFEIFPVRGRTIIACLITQKKGYLYFKKISEMFERSIVIRERPVQTYFHPLEEIVLDGIFIRITTANAWRKALKEEIEFLAKKMSYQGLYFDETYLKDEFIIVKPELNLISPTVSFRTSNWHISVSTENLKQFENMVKERIIAHGGNLNSNSIYIGQVGNIHSFILKAIVERTEFKIYLKQFFVPAGKKTLIITLSSADGNSIENSGELASLINSIEIQPLNSKSLAETATKKVSSSTGSNHSWYTILFIAGVITVIFLAALYTLSTRKIKSILPGKKIRK